MKWGFPKIGDPNIVNLGHGSTNLTPPRQCLVDGGLPYILTAKTHTLKKKQQHRNTEP